MGRFLAGVLAMLLASAAPAAAKPHHNSFDGSCRLTGVLEFDQPLGMQPITTTFADSATGTCTGRLNGSDVRDIPVVNVVTGTATASCGAGEAHTVDTLIFAGRWRIGIFTDSDFALTQGVAHTRGAVSGESVEHVDLLPYADQALLGKCAAGALYDARYDLMARTITPLVG